eukprot:scaffold269090_cov41-Tisochrysis_lutea.AAC.1
MDKEALVRAVRWARDMHSWMVAVPSPSRHQHCYAGLADRRSADIQSSNRYPFDILLDIWASSPDAKLDVPNGYLIFGWILLDIAWPTPTSMEHGCCA